jgi:hypothetical protein
VKAIRLSPYFPVPNFTIAINMAGQQPPRIHNEIYPFLHPSKFRNSLKGQNVLITGTRLGNRLCSSKKKTVLVI